MRALFVCLLSIAGCSNEFLYRPKERTYEDKIDGRRITEFSEIALESDFSGGYGFRLGITRIEHRAGPTVHFLELTYHGGQWIFLSDGESIVFLLNGKDRLALGTIASAIHRSVTAGGTVLEVASYPVTADELRALARAESIDVKIVADRGYVNARVLGKSKEALRAFVERMIG